MKLTLNTLRELLADRPSEKQVASNESFHAVSFNQFKHPFYKALEKIAGRQNTAAAAAGGDADASDRELSFDELGIIATNLFHYRDDKPQSPDEKIYTTLLKSFPYEVYLVGLIERGFHFDGKAKFMLEHHLKGEESATYALETCLQVTFAERLMQRLTHNSARTSNITTSFSSHSAKAILSFLCQPAENIEGFSDEIIEDLSKAFWILNNEQALTADNIAAIRHRLSLDPIMIDPANTEHFQSIAKCLIMMDESDLSLDDKSLVMTFVSHEANMPHSFNASPGSMAHSVATILALAKANVVGATYNTGLKDFSATVEPIDANKKAMLRPTRQHLDESKIVANYLQTEIYQGATIPESICRIVFHYPELTAQLSMIIRNHLQRQDKIEEFFALFPEELSSQDAYLLSLNIKRLSLLFWSTDTAWLDTVCRDYTLLHRYVVTMVARYKYLSGINDALITINGGVVTSHDNQSQIEGSREKPFRLIETYFNTLKTSEDFDLYHAALKLLHGSDFLNQQSFNIIFTQPEVALSLCSIYDMPPETARFSAAVGGAAAGAVAAATGKMHKPFFANTILLNPHNAIELALKAGATFTNRLERSGRDFQRAINRFVGLYRTRILAQLEMTKLEQSKEPQELRMLGAKRRQFLFFQEDNKQLNDDLLIEIAAQASEILPVDFVREELRKFFTQKRRNDLTALIEKDYETETIPDASAAAAAAGKLG